MGTKMDEMTATALKAIIARALLNTQVGDSETTKVHSVDIGPDGINNQQLDTLSWILKNSKDKAVALWSARQTWVRCEIDITDTAYGYITDNGRIVYCVEDKIPWGVDLRLGKQNED